MIRYIPVYFWTKDPSHLADYRFRNCDGCSIYLRYKTIQIRAYFLNQIQSSSSGSVPDQTKSCLEKNSYDKRPSQILNKNASSQSRWKYLNNSSIQPATECSLSSHGTLSRAFPSSDIASAKHTRSDWMNEWMNEWKNVCMYVRTCVYMYICTSFPLLSFLLILILTSSQLILFSISLASFVWALYAW